MFKIGLKDTLSAFGVDAEGEERSMRVRYHLLCKSILLLNELIGSINARDISEPQFSRVLVFFDMAQTKFKDGKLKATFQPNIEWIAHLQKCLCDENKNINHKDFKDINTLLGLTSANFEGALEYYSCCLSIDHPRNLHKLTESLKIPDTSED